MASLLTLGLGACGAEVVGGGGGSGGTGSGVSSTTNNSTTTGPGGGGLGQCIQEGGTGSTTGSAIECKSTFSCTGGEVSIECSAPEGGEASCDCYRGDGVLVGSCTSPDFATECVFPQSCCFDVFAGGGGTGGEGSSGSGGEGGGPNGTTEPCEAYCNQIAEYCTVENAMYANINDCFNVCRKFPAGGEGDVDGNSLACRSYYLSVASDSPADNCRYAGPGTEGRCGGSCENFCFLAIETCTGETAQWPNQAALAFLAA